MDKIIDVCKRVEGHGTVDYLIRDEAISHVEFKINTFRGFENILTGKNVFDIPKIVSRICGLCHTSQTLASCKAIESLYEITSSAFAINLRRVLMCAELIKSHIMHFFFQTLPDLIEIFKLDYNLKNLSNLINFDPELTKNVFNLIRASKEINELFGGRIIHLITPVPGGILYTPSQKNYIFLQKLLHKMREEIESIIHKCISLFSGLQTPQEYNFPSPLLIGLYNHANFDRYDGNIRISNLSDYNEIFEKAEYSKYFNKDVSLFGVNFKESNNNPVLTGPYSRYWIHNCYKNEKISEFLNLFDKTWKKSLIFSNILQLVEIYYELQNNLENLDENQLNNKIKIPNLDKLKSEDGIGIIEAPRGFLMHHYQINKKNNVEKVKLFIATELNIPIINVMIENYAQKQYETKDIDSIKKTIQIMIRLFDPCISCATH